MTPYVVCEELAARATPVDKTDFAIGYRNDLKAGVLPEMVLTSARKHQEGLRALPIIDIRRGDRGHPG